MFFKNKLRIGIDIGSCRIKTALVSYDRRKILSLLSVRTRPGREFRSEEIALDDYVSAVKDIASRIPGKSDYSLEITSAIQDKGLISRYIELPPLPDREIQTAVESVASKALPSLNDVTITVLRVPPLTAGPKVTSAFYIVTGRALKEKDAEIMKMAGLKINRLDITSLGIIREFNANHRTETGQFISIIHTGYELTHFIVIRDGYPYFIRKIAIGGGDMTHAFQMGQQNNWEEAEKYKLSYDMARRDVEIEPFLERWFREIKMSCKGFERLKGAVPLSRIYLSGGNSLLKGLPDRMREETGIPAEVDRWDRLKIPVMDADEDSHSIIFKTAVGLAL